MAIISDTDKLVRVQMDKKFLGDLILARGLKSGESVTSDLPEDARVLHVYESTDDMLRRNDVFTMVVASETFDRVAQGQLPPLRYVTLTRRITP